MDLLQSLWRDRTRTYRILLVSAAIYGLLRLAVHVAFLVILPSYTSEGYQVPVDLQIYLDATQRLQNGQPLYPQGPDRIEVYQYSPAFALAFVPFLALPPLATALIHTLLHLVAYALLYLRWEHIFRMLGLERAQYALRSVLPMWILFSSFWTDLGYLNIYIIVALFATMLIEAILQEQFGWSLFWLSIILQIKPHWAFAAALPLLLGQHRFFWKIVGAAILVYGIIAGAVMIALGLPYGWQQYTGYVRFLAQMRAYFPWRDPASPYLGYNHSITQTVVYVLGISPTSFQLATMIRGLILIPAVVLLGRTLWQTSTDRTSSTPRAALDLTFILYLAVFVWLDMVWELSLGVVLYAYLISDLPDRPTILISIPFWIYALLDPLRVISFVLSMIGLDIIDPGPYILTDPNIYLPTIMFAILTFYATLIGRRWKALRQPLQSLHAR
jgi:hypothetical protein